MENYEGIERYRLEDMAHELAAQCRCYSYNGPCRFCNKLEKVHRQIDKLDVEEQVIKEITAWMTNPKFITMTIQEFIDAVGYGLATRAWKKKDVPK